MGIDGVKDGKLLYHLTRLENIDLIIANGLLSRKVVKNKNIKFSDVADGEIISKRTFLGLDKYIPFHFHPYSSFDVAVKNKYQDAKFMYICISRRFAENNHFKILPIHPLSLDKFSLLEYDNGIESIDWDTMSSIGVDSDYIKHVKMAECLTENSINVEDFSCIYVKDNETKLLVEKKLRDKGIKFNPPFVNVGKWF